MSDEFITPAELGGGNGIVVDLRTNGRSNIDKLRDADNTPHEPTVLSYQRHREISGRVIPKHLVKNLLPETGVGLLSGQNRHL
jgi:hypothetical protein